MQQAWRSNCQSAPLSAGLVATALLFLAASAAMVASEAFTAEQKTALVISHNNLRQAAAGPQAADMNFVIWDNTLEDLATKAAEKCQSSTHYTTGEYEGFGQSIFATTETTISRVTDITLAWYSERYNLKSTELQESGNCKAGKVCGHYTQMMMAAVTSIGCGMSNACGGKFKTVVYCQYSKSQMSGQSVFASGPPCSKCSKEMPFCLHGLCISKDLAASQMAKNFDPTASVACQLSCADCGTRDTSSGSCKCSCGSTDYTGGTCDAKAAGAAAKCSPCRETPPCQNGGTEDASDKAKCSCKCTSGFVGNRCEIAKDVFDSSVKLVISAREEFKFSSDPVMPPISRSHFNSKLWPALQAKIASVVNAFCRANAERYQKCCPGSNFPGTEKLASVDHIGASDVKFTESSVQNTQDGSLNLFIHAVVSGNGVCPAKSRRRRDAVKFVPQSVLLSTIEANIDQLSLAIATGDAKLKQVTKASSAEGEGKPPGGSGNLNGRVSLALTLSHLALYLLISSFLD